MFDNGRLRFWNRPRSKEVVDPYREVREEELEISFEQSSVSDVVLNSNSQWDFGSFMPVEEPVSPFMKEMNIVEPAEEEFSSFDQALTPKLSSPTKQLRFQEDYVANENSFEISSDLTRLSGDLASPRKSLGRKQRSRKSPLGSPLRSFLQSNSSGSDLEGVPEPSRNGDEGTPKKHELALTPSAGA